MVHKTSLNTHSVAYDRVALVVDLTANLGYCHMAFTARFSLYFAEGRPINRRSRSSRSFRLKSPWVFKRLISRSVVSLTVDVSQLSGVAMEQACRLGTTAGSMMRFRCNCGLSRITTCSNKCTQVVSLHRCSSTTLGRVRKHRRIFPVRQPVRKQHCKEM
jgi:hypothetical protein